MPSVGPARIRSEIVFAPAGRRQVIGDLDRAGFRLPRLSPTVSRLAGLPGERYAKFLAFLRDVRSGIRAEGKVLLYLPPASELSSMRAEVLIANRHNVIDDCFSGGILDLRKASGVAYKIYRQQAGLAVVQTPLPLLAQASAGDVERLIDFITEERKQFARIAAKANASVPKIFHSIRHGADKLPFLNVIIHQPSEISDGVWAPTLKKVIEGKRAIYDVDIDDPPSFERAGLAVDPTAIRSELERSKGPGRMLFIPLVRTDGVVEAVIEIHNRVPLGDSRDTPPLLSATPPSAERIKTELVTYFQAAVFAIETVRQRKLMATGAAPASPATQPGRPEQAEVKITHSNVNALPANRIKREWGPIIFFAVVFQRIRLWLGFPPRQKSELVDYYNKPNERIRAYIDYPENANLKNIRWVVIPPAFGYTKERAYALALYLTKNGFGVLRYDDTCSVGESQGDVMNLTLSGSTKNVTAAIDHLSHNFGATKIVVVPMSLSTRPSIRAAAQDDRIGYLVPIVGVPNVESVIGKVCGRETVQEYRTDGRTGPTAIWGHMVDGRFVTDADENQLLDLGSTISDMERVKVPVIWYCGGDDKLVDPEEVRQVLAVPHPSDVKREVYIYDGVGHQVRDSGKVPELFAEVVRQIMSLTTGQEVGPEQVIHPSGKEMMKKRSAELSRIARPRLSRQEEISAWAKYLKEYDTLTESIDYNKYLEDVWDLLDLRPGDKILDAGCGTGNGLVLGLEIMAKKLKLNGWRKGLIVGLDFVAKGLETASEKAQKARALRPDDLPPLALRRADLEVEDIPYKNRYFDKIVASLLLSYIKSPEKAVRKLCSKLKDDGTIVLTSLKPGADTFPIFDRYIQRLASQGGDIKEAQARARTMLGSVTHFIGDREDRGEFKFFSPEELAAMLEANGCEIVSIKMSFDNQAVIVTARKIGKRKKKLTPLAA